MACVVSMRSALTAYLEFGFTKLGMNLRSFSHNLKMTPK